MPNADLRSIFVGQQRLMETDLEVNRQNEPHAPTKGSVAEAKWIVMLEKFLPKRYAATSGFVIDWTGARSDQIDVILHDVQYSPRLQVEGGCRYVPAESVYAVFEVKQTLNKEFIKAAGDKAASVRALDRTSASYLNDLGRAKPKLRQPIIAGLLALESDWSPGLGNALRTALGELDAGRNVSIIMRQNSLPVKPPFRPLLAC